MPARKVRVRGGQADGPLSAVWLVWTTQRTSDGYVACRHVAANLKVRLHQSGNWRPAYTPGDLLQSGQSGDPSVGRVAIRLDTRHERAAQRVAATRQARLARRPITTIEELVILLTAAADERTSDAFFETFWDRATPEVVAAFEVAIPAEAARRGAGGWTKQD